MLQLTPLRLGEALGYRYTLHVAGALNKGRGNGWDNSQGEGWIFSETWASISTVTVTGTQYINRGRCFIEMMFLQHTSDNEIVCFYLNSPVTLAFTCTRPQVFECAAVCNGILCKQNQIYYWSKWKRRNYSRCNRYQKCCVRKLWDQLLKPIRKNGFKPRIWRHVSGF